MYKTAACWVAMAALALSAGASCKKKDKAAGETAAPATAPATPTEASPAPAAPAAAPAANSAAAIEAAEVAAADKAEKQALLAYATMEDAYLNDAKGQWAIDGKASSSFGGAGTKEGSDPHSSNTPWQASGAPNGNGWSNDHQDMGIDWLEVSFAKPVSATELRVVLTGVIGAMSKVELIDEAGAPHELWSGTDETKRDGRGPRTWFVRTFEKTPYKVAKAKLSFANAVVTGYKEVDAVQLVGE